MPGCCAASDLMARAQLCSSTMAPGEGGSGVASAPLEEAATFEQLGAPLPPAATVLPAVKLRCHQRRAQGTDVHVRADHPILQLIANKLSICHYLQTLSLVRCGLQAYHLSLSAAAQGNSTRYSIKVNTLFCSADQS